MNAKHPHSNSVWIREEPREGRLLLRAALVAMTVHLIVLTIDIPRQESLPMSVADDVVRRREPINWRKLPLQAPALTPTERRVTAPARRKPIPMRESIAIEPTPEHVGEIAVATEFAGDEALIPYEDLQPPPAGVRSEPRIVTSDVTAPQLIDGSRVDPDYPHVARFGRVQGRVVLQAVILESGEVTSVEVLSCTRPGYGLEQSAIEAVRQWRYLPAMQDGAPVAVYFTIVVQFSLQ